MQLIITISQLACKQGLTFGTSHLYGVCQNSGVSKLNEQIPFDL